MLTYSEGSYRSVRDRTQLMVRVREIDDETGEAGKWTTLTKMTTIPFGDKRHSERALLAWRDDLVGEAAVARARAKGELPLDEKSIVDAMSKRLGIHEDRLSLPFNKYAQEYIETKRKSAGVGTNRGVNNGGSDSILRLWILPYLPSPETPINQITSDMVHSMLLALADANYSAGTILKAWTLFKSIFKYAVNIDGLRPDPCYGIKNIKKTKARLNFLDPKAADVLARQLTFATQSDAVCAARLALATGIEGEALCGLQLRHCDPQYVDAIHVNQVVSKRNGQYELLEPKNEFRDRIIPFNSEIKFIIDDRKNQLATDFGCEVSELSQDLFLLASPGMKREWLSPDKLRAKWKSVATALGAKGNLGQIATIHDLRHTFATSFLAKGGSFADLKAIMGHSTGYMTLEIYASSDVACRADSMEKTGRNIQKLKHEKLKGEALIKDIFEFGEVIKPKPKEVMLG